MIHRPESVTWPDLLARRLVIVGAQTGLVVSVHARQSIAIFRSSLQSVHLPKFELLFLNQRSFLMTEATVLSSPTMHPVSIMS